MQGQRSVKACISAISLIIRGDPNLIADLHRQLTDLPNLTLGDSFIRRL
jgi:hypothetical protein